MSQDYQTRQWLIEEGNPSGPIRTGHNQHTPPAHSPTRATTQGSSCSSAIPSHHSRKSFRATTHRMPRGYPYPEPQLKDMFRATTHETLASSPSRYLRNIVDPPSSLKLESIQYCNHFASELIIHSPLGLNIHLSPKHSSSSRSG